jgi:hypothetical protein
MVFSTKSKKTYTPLEWAGTRQRAVFAVRNQHTVQVKPVEGQHPLERGSFVPSQPNWMERMVCAAKLHKLYTPPEQYLSNAVKE